MKKEYEFLCGNCNPLTNKEAYELFERDLSHLREITIDPTDTEKLLEINNFLAETMYKWTDDPRKLETFGFPKKNLETGDTYNYTLYEPLVSMTVGVGPSIWFVGRGWKLIWRQKMQFDKIFCDLDGVLVGFARQVVENSGKKTKKLSDKECEKELSRIQNIWKFTHNPRFWYDLPWMKDGQELWEYIYEYQPIILTAMSRDKKCNDGKRYWCKENLGPIDPAVITCFGRYQGIKGLGKVKAAQDKNWDVTQCLLIDDNAQIIDQWRQAGGTGILHTSTEDTINKLKELGY